MNDNDEAPAPPDPMFDGHPERPFAELSWEEKLDELWLRACAVRELRELRLQQNPKEP